MRSSPLPIRIFAVIAIPNLIYGAFNATSRPALAWGGILLTVVLIVFVLRGSRVAWSLVVFGDAVAVVTFPFMAMVLWSVILAAIRLGCLLAPTSRKFVWGEAPPLTADALEKVSRTWNPRAYPDQSRPKGWYINPSSPNRMHYWGAVDPPSWGASTRTPRKIRREWEADNEE